MAHISPFRAWRYDAQRVCLGDVVTQPYDKITPALQDQYYEASPYNLVRVILGKPEATDSGGEVYQRAAKFYRDWRRAGIVRQDAEPRLYRYTQRFQVPGQTLERHGLIAIGRVEDYSAGIVFRHERTLSRPKADRLNLLRATRAHFGQIFMLYSDPADEIQSAVASAPVAATGEAVEVHAGAEGEYGVDHTLTPVSDPQFIEKVCGLMRDKKLIIADGHHRYETALNYRDECRSATGSTDGLPSPAEAAIPPYEFVMMTLVNMDSPGAVILPTHRVVHGLADFSAETFRARALEYFRLEEVDPAVDVMRATAILRQAGHTGNAILAVASGRAFLVHTPKAISSEVFVGYSLRQQYLDVVQLHRCLIELVLGISPDATREQRNISYVRDPGEALSMVRGGGANIAFLMNPVRINQVRDIAFAGEVLPQKSTDFYPKLLSGLTIYALE
jgi:uncharacterized protein (DUF1015 family)